jgi:hypothetical protein
MKQKMSNNSSSQDIIMILDESGSMHTMGVEPIQAVNAFITEQQRIPEKVGCTFSLWKFNTNVNQVIDDQPLKDVTEFKDYRVGGMTALLDAIGLAIATKRSKAKQDNVICVILTDGFENASKEYTAKQIKDLINEMELYHNWKFVYLGANQDSFTVGDSYGMNKGRCMNFQTTPGNLTRQVQTVSASIGSYRRNTAQGIPNTDLVLDSSATPTQLARQERIKNTPSILASAERISRGRLM